MKKNIFIINLIIVTVLSESFNHKSDSKLINKQILIKRLLNNYTEATRSTTKKQFNIVDAIFKEFSIVSVVSFCIVK